MYRLITNLEVLEFGDFSFGIEINFYRSREGEIFHDSNTILWDDKLILHLEKWLRMKINRF